MALRDTEWAYHLELPAPQKAVILALAHCRNGKTGRCFPGQQELVSMTGLSEATVRRSLGALETAGIITRTATHKGRYRSNDEYTLHHDYQSDRPPVTLTASQSDHRSEGASPPVTVTLTTGHSDGAVVPTGIEPEPNRKRGTASRGSRIPDPFIVTADMRQWASQETPAIDVDHSTRMFVDHWRAATRNATKLDWPATWRNWLRRDQQDRPRTKQTPEERMRATLALNPTLQLKEIQ